MLFVLLGLQAITLIALLALLFRKPPSAAEAAADPRLAQLLAADLPTQLTRFSAQFTGLEGHLRGELAQMRGDNTAGSASLRGEVLSSINLLVWIIYGVLTGIAGVLLGAFLGVSSDNAGTLTASAFSIVVLGGLGSVSGSLIAAFVVGYLETLTAYLVSPAYRTIPALLLLVIVMYIRPQGLLGRR